MEFSANDRNCLSNGTSLGNHRSSTTEDNWDYNKISWHWLVVGGAMMTFKKPKLLNNAHDKRHIATIGRKMYFYDKTQNAWNRLLLSKFKSWTSNSSIKPFSKTAVLMVTLTASLCVWATCCLLCWFFAKVWFLCDKILVQICLSNNEMPFPKFWMSSLEAESALNQNHSLLGLQLVKSWQSVAIMYIVLCIVIITKNQVSF